MRSKLDRFLALNKEEKRLFLRAWLLLLGVDLGLRWIPFKQLRALLRLEADQVRKAEEGPSLDRSLSEERARAWRTWQVMDKAARNHLYEMTCLRRSLVLQRLLIDQGLKAELKIGVRKDDGNLLAHAWVELDGAAVGDQAGIEQSYAQLARLGARR